MFYFNYLFHSSTVQIVKFHFLENFHFRLLHSGEFFFFCDLVPGLYPFLWKAGSLTRLLLEQYSESVFQYCCNNRRTKWPRSLSNDCNNSCQELLFRGHHCSQRGLSVTLSYTRVLWGLAVYLSPSFVRRVSPKNKAIGSFG